MKPILVFGMCVSVSLTVVAQANLSASPRIVAGYGNLPMAFEANQGQTDAQVKYLSRGVGYTLFLTPLRRSCLYAKTRGKNPHWAARNPKPHRNKHRAGLSLPCFA